MYNSHFKEIFVKGTGGDLMAIHCHGVFVGMHVIFLGKLGQTLKNKTEKKKERKKERKKEKTKKERKEHKSVSRGW
jgi:hypothetical protein